MPPKKDITVLITGANRGLGLEMVKQFAADGYKVIGTARKPEKATDLKATGATVIKLDVTSEEDIAAMAKTLKGQKIDILINNAGYFGPKLMTENPDNITKLTRQEMTTCINVNTLGPIFVTQALLPNLRLSPMKKVVNISTRAASPGGTAYGYRISKTALNMVTRCMSVDAGMRGIDRDRPCPGAQQNRHGNAPGKSRSCAEYEESEGADRIVDAKAPRQALVLRRLADAVVILVFRWF